MKAVTSLSFKKALQVLGFALGSLLVLPAGFRTTQLRPNLRPLPTKPAEPWQTLP